MLLGKVLECVVTTDIGGQLSYASLIENYPGFDAAPGINLVLKIQQQAVSFGTEVFIDEVEHIEKKDDVFVVKTRRGTVFETLAIIAACADLLPTLKGRGFPLGGSLVSHIYSEPHLWSAETNGKS